MYDQSRTAVREATHCKLEGPDQVWAVFFSLGHTAGLRYTCSLPAKRNVAPHAASFGCKTHLMVTHFNVPAGMADSVHAQCHLVTYMASPSLHIDLAGSLCDTATQHNSNTCRCTTHAHGLDITIKPQPHSASRLKTVLYDKREHPPHTSQFHRFRRIIMSGDNFTDSMAGVIHYMAGKGHECWTR